ncbi:hypothetical protein GCM10017776_05640 [Streptomyces griseoluteus]|nr:hypothetical protein GCM10017776_05640 [Streptomyces griseoluteus]
MQGVCTGVVCPVCRVPGGGAGERGDRILLAGRAWGGRVLGTVLLPVFGVGWEEGDVERQIRVRVSRRPAAPRGQEIDRRTPSGRVLPY